MMDLEALSREELVHRLRAMEAYFDNVIVFWGDRNQLRETLSHVSKNEDGAYTAEEALNAKAILDAEGAFDQLIEMLRDSFDRGGINWAISEKMSAIMAEVAERHRKM
jgi:hypothetical protein